MTEWWTATKAKLVALAIGIAIVIAAIGVLELWHLYTLGAQVHWGLGAGLVAAALLLLTALVIVPAARFLKMPAHAQPPLMPPDPTVADLRRRLAYLDLRFEAFRPDVAALRAKCTDGADVAARSMEIRALESDKIEPTLKEIDAKVDAMIREEALNVGFATAVSGNGGLDAFVVFWRSVVLVSRIATAYYGRPGLRGTLLIIKDVALAIAAAKLAQTATDWLAKALPTMLPAFAGSVLVPPIVDGGFNLIMTMKVGHLAKRRCRSFVAWDEAEREKSVLEVLSFVASQMAMLVVDFVARLGGLVTKGVVATAGAGVAAVGNAAKGMWDAVAGWFGFRGAPTPG